MRNRRRALAAAISILATLLLLSKPVHADDVVPPAPAISGLLSLEDAVKLFRQRGLDLLIADAAARNAEGAVKIAGAAPNPVITTSVGNAFTYSTSASSKAGCFASGAACSPWIYNIGINDSAALEDTVTGKRDLRLRAARNALAAARLSRADSERTLLFQVKSAYVQVAQAALSLKFATDVAASQDVTLKRAQDRFRGGATNEGDLQRIEAQKLEADQAVDNAVNGLAAARFGLAFLLGVRGRIPDFEVDTKTLDYAVPVSLRDASDIDLLRAAFEHRPDLLSLGFQKQQAEAQLALVKRQKFPDISLGVSYAWGGFGGYSTNGPIQGQTITVSLSTPLPVFYSLQGEQRQAEAQRDTNALQQAKTTAQVANDVSTALAAFAAARRLVERMEGPRRPGGGLLASARGGFETVAAQYDRGGASLTDYLDALRSYIATRTEYIGDLANYWTAVYQVEASIAKDVR